MGERQHAIEMHVDGNSVQMNYGSLVGAMLTELAHEVNKNPGFWVDRFRDIASVHVAESRGFSITGTCLDDLLDGIYKTLGYPILGLTPTEASNHGKRMSDLAYEAMTPSDRAVHDAYAARKAERTAKADPPAAMAQVMPLSETNTPIYEELQNE